MITFENEDIKFYTGGFEEFADFVFSELNVHPIIIVHINLRNFYYLNNDRKLKHEIGRYCLVVFDGIGLKIGFWLKGYGFLPDLNGTDLFPLFMRKIAAKKMSIYLLGSDPEIIERARKNISASYPNVSIAGFHHGYYSDEEELNIVNEIIDSGADVLMIGRGFPAQEQFILKHREKLSIPLVWNVGGLFDLISGSKPRAPYLMRKMRLEWLFRFLLEPRRMLFRNTICAAWSLGHLLLTKRAVKV